MNVAMAQPVVQGQLVEVRNLRIESTDTAGHRVVIAEDVSFTLRQGEVLALLGETGAGKTSIGLTLLARAQAGCRISGGEILVEGHDLRTLGPAACRSLRGAKAAYVPSNAAAFFNPAHTLYEQVCEVALQHGTMTYPQARTEAAHLFRELDLPNSDMIGNRYPHQVPRSQLQRVMLAMAMTAKPDILVLDDPTEDLDPPTQFEVLASFKRLIRDYDVATLYLSRDPAIIAQIAERVIVLQGGRMVEEGPVAQVLLHPQADHTRGLVSAQTSDQRSRARAPMDEAAAPILAVQNLIAGEPDGSSVVDDVTLDLRRGETLAVVGAAGSGKDALVRSIVGLLPRLAGDILLDGTSLKPGHADRNRDVHRRLQMIHRQAHLALNPRGTVLDLVGRPLAFYFGKRGAEIRARVEELLQQVGLAPDLVARKPHELSTADGLLVCIARALAAEPDVILCDDITAPLGPLEADRVLQQLGRTQVRGGPAWLLATRDPSVARRLADNVAILQKGQLVAYGPMQQVFNPPYHQYTELLLSSVPEMRPDWLDEVLRRRRKVAR